MINSQYGFAGLNKNFNSNIGNDNLAKRIDQLESKLIPARVIDIILDETHPDFVNQGEWNSIGFIIYELINSPENPDVVRNIAKPLLSNTKHFPLKNEIVFLIKLPNTTSLTLWNHPHHNAFPSQPNQLPESQRKDYRQTTIGNVRRVTDQSTEINLGNTFIERSNIHPLLPFEGDTIYEGRWGNLY